MSGATNIDEGASRIHALLNPEPEQPPEGNVEEPVQPEAQPVEEAPAEDLYTVKVNGEEREVTLDDLKSGYMMQSDYTKKTSSHAEAVRAFEQEVQARTADLDAKIEQAEALAELEIASLESEEMQSLKLTDPDGYIRELDKAQKRIDALNTLKEKRADERAQAQQEQAQRELQALTQAIPEWLDEDVRKTEAGELLKYLSENGYSNDELSGMLDHRQWVLARKAMKLDSISLEDLEAKKVKTPPKTQQPAAKQEPVSQSDTKVKDLRAQLRKSGDMKDAAKLFQSLME